MHEDDGNLQNDARTCDASDTRLTQLRSLKVLSERYQSADEIHKPGIAFYLRKSFNAFNAGGLDAEDPT